MSFSTFVAALMMALATSAQKVLPATDEVRAQTMYDANAKISHWINPNAFVGIVLMIFFFWISYCVFGALAAVQGPKIMLEKTIDWGKVERTEE